MTEGNGFTTKELLVRIWDELKDFRGETNHRFEKVEGEVATLRSDRDKTSMGRDVLRTVGFTFITALVAAGVAAWIG